MPLRLLAEWVGVYDLEVQIVNIKFVGCYTKISPEFLKWTWQKKKSNNLSEMYVYRVPTHSTVFSVEFENYIS